VSRYQEDLLEQEILTVASSGPYANLHLAPDRYPCQYPVTVYYRPDPNQQHHIKALKATHIHILFYGRLGFCLALPGWAGTRKVKPIWIYWSKR